LDASVGPTFSVYKEGGGTTAISTGVMTKVSLKTGFYEGNFTVPLSLYAVGQHFILLEATVDGQTPKASITFQLVAATQSVEQTFQEIQDIGANVPSIGSGTESIDHNFGGTDNLRVVAGGTPIADVSIRAFVASDYASGRYSNNYVVGQTKTLTDGRWSTVIRLNKGTYTLEFSKAGSFKTSTANIQV